MKFIVENIPSNLPLGTKCQTRVVKATWAEIRLEYVGPFDSDDPCLFPMTIESENYANV